MYLIVCVCVICGFNCWGVKDPKDSSLELSRDTLLVKSLYLNLLPIGHFLTVHTVQVAKEPTLIK